MKYPTVIFDLDSTIVTIEGLDWLAAQSGVGEQVKKLTDASMNGELDFRQAFIQKNAILRPTKSQLQTLGHQYISSYTPGAKQVISQLQANDQDIYIITGNFQEAAHIVALDLGIPLDHVFANRINYDESGNYRSLDTDYPLTFSDGKSQIISQLKQTVTSPIAFIGDGATDLAVQNTVDLFIGYGGVAYRPSIEAQSKLYIKDLDLNSILPYVK